MNERARMLMFGALLFTAGLAAGMGIAVWLALSVLQMEATYPAAAPWIVWA